MLRRLCTCLRGSQQGCMKRTIESRSIPKRKKKRQRRGWSVTSCTAGCVVRCVLALRFEFSEELSPPQASPERALFWLRTCLHSSQRECLKSNLQSRCLARLQTQRQNRQRCGWFATICTASSIARCVRALSLTFSEELFSPEASDRVLR